jgi:hypothetical protein
MSDSTGQFCLCTYRQSRQDIWCGFMQVIQTSWISFVMVEFGILVSDLFSTICAPYVLRSGRRDIFFAWAILDQTMQRG